MNAYTKIAFNKRIASNLHHQLIHSGYTWYILNKLMRVKLKDKYHTIRTNINEK